MSHRSKRKILVIGGSSGIGAAIAQVFASNGDLVVATGATKEEVERAQVQSGSTAISFQELDVRDGSAVQACIDEINSLDVLVNCAGV
ncbi:MAG: SDR family NAD(P)-dependent oxidoreductase, partial [SAR324 cluster bacterium]|nr:SDR family NAD(P)-dependent oxidoreductase [SAR324 cluster bacterium]